MKAKVYEEMIFMSVLDFTHNARSGVKRLFIPELNATFSPLENTLFIHIPDWTPNREGAEVVLIKEIEIPEEIAVCIRSFVGASNQLYVHTNKIKEMME